MNWKEAPENEIVCYCQRVNKGTIIDAIKSGKTTLVQIKEATTACTGGNCKEKNPSGKCCSDDILQLISLYSSDSKDKGSCCCCCNK